MLRLLVAFSALALLSITAHYHDGRGPPVHVPKDYHYPPNHHNGGRGRRGLVAAEGSDESEDREEKKDWRGHKGHDFVSSLPEEAKRAFFSIKMDEDLSRDEKREKILDWAQENAVEDEVSAYLTAKDTEIRRKKEAVAAAIEELPEAYEKVSAIFDDSSLSRKEQREKMEEMTREYSEELKSLLRASLPCGGRKDHRQMKWNNRNFGMRRHGSRRTFAEEEEVEF